MNLKIALSGPAGTGKSTVLRDLKNSAYIQVAIPKNHGEFTFIEEPVRALKKKTGMAINDLATIDTELLVLSTHIQNLILYPMLITDRCIVDNIVYTKLSKDFEEKDKYIECVEFFERKTIDNFDLIFYIKPEFYPPEDGVRKLDQDFYQASIDMFDRTYAELMTKHSNIHILKGSREERTRFIEDKIYEIIKEKE